MYFGNFWNYFKFVKESGASRDEEPPCGCGHRSGKSAAVERTAGDTTSRERFEGGASV